MKNQVALEHFDNRLLSGVIVGGTETAGGDDDPAAFESQTKGVHHGVHRVTNRTKVPDYQPGISQAAGNMRGVGIDRVAGYNLITDSNDLDVHGSFHFDNSDRFNRY